MPHRRVPMRARRRLILRDDRNQSRHRIDQVVPRLPRGAMMIGI
jgi:hypothetical protein